MRIFALLFIFAYSAYSNDASLPKCKPGKEAVFSNGAWVCQLVKSQSESFIPEDSTEGPKESPASSDLSRITNILEKIANKQCNCINQSSGSEPSSLMGSLYSTCTEIPSFITKNGRGITALLITASLYSGYLSAYRPSMYAAFGLSFLPVDFVWTGSMILAANLAPSAWPIAQQITNFNSAPGTFLTTVIGAGIRFVVSQSWQAIGGNRVNNMVQNAAASAAASYYDQDAFGTGPRQLPTSAHSTSGGFLTLSIEEASARGWLSVTPPVSQTALSAAAAIAP
jgi:hypothetical protein